MKYAILKALDVAGLKVLEPIIRLLCGEEPMVQVKKIGLFIVVPILTFLIFIGGWAYVGPRHKTKSGEVPGPGRVLEAWNGIVQFADRENQKGVDFAASGELREAQLAQVQKQRTVVTKLSEISTEKFKTLEKVRERALSKDLGDLEKMLELQEKKNELNSAKRESLLLAQAAKIGTNDTSAKGAFLKKIVDHLKISESESELAKDMRSELDEKRQQKLPALEKERKRKNSLDQMKQFLQKRESFLGSANKSVKVERLTGGITKERDTFFAATEPTEMLASGTKVVKSMARLSKVEESEYAKPPTFFEQIRTSLACVFLGFVIATAIAIPIGVLCGLSDVFMAAMSPLISLFKPVSPIVWLPIVFIIIGGFNLPEIKGYWAWAATPSFLASAITVALCSLWPTLVNTALGVASIDKDHVNVARVLRLGFWSRLFKIVIPSALPLIFAGLRISLGVGWMVLIAAELLSSSPGLGKYVWDMFNNGSSATFAQMFVVVFVVGLIGLLLDRMMIVFQRLVSFDGAATAL